MIGSIALALQIAAATTPGVLSVRGPGSESTVPLIQTTSGPALSIEQLALVIPLSIETPGEGRYVIRVAGGELKLTDQIPFARLNGEIVPLASAPFVAAGRLNVPLEVVSDLLPRGAPTRLHYDSEHAELRFSGPATDARVVASSSSSSRKTPSRVRGKGTRRRVVVDAGHGGPDHGMSGPIDGNWSMDEKDVTLAVAKKLDIALRNRGVDVIMTRTTDTLIALSDRGRIANEQHGDVFVSIHVNAAPLTWQHPEDSRGYETYFLAEAKTEDAKRVERMENESVHFETNTDAEVNDPLSFIKNDMAQNEHLRESNELAALIQKRLGTVHPGPSRGVKQAGFRVLVTAFMPAVLVEIGFGTNDAEAHYLTSNTRQREIAEAIADATMEYLAHYERRLGTTNP